MCATITAVGRYEAGGTGVWRPTWARNLRCGLRCTNSWTGLRWLVTPRRDLACCCFVDSGELLRLLLLPLCGYFLCCYLHKYNALIHFWRKGVGGPLFLASKEEEQPRHGRERMGCLQSKGADDSAAAKRNRDLQRSLEQVRAWF